MKKYILRVMGILSVICVCVFNFSEQASVIRKYDDVVYYEKSEELSDFIGSVNGGITSTGEVEAGVSFDERLKGNEITVSLFGNIPVKTVEFVEKEDIYVVPSGECVGIDMEFDGVLVVGISDVSGKSSPAKKAGVRTGDYITHANGIKIDSSEALSSVCTQNDVKLTVFRDGKIKELIAKPEYDEKSDSYKLGVWVRESTAGIGTLTYYNSESGRFAALGHPVCDVDTGTIFTVKGGCISKCSITSVRKGEKGMAGEITGSFNDDSMKYGYVSLNNDFGIYGDITEQMQVGEAVKMAYPDEVHTGEATILCGVMGEVTEYSCKIIKTTKQSQPTAKSMIVEITDKRLIDATGGIVQGMSGSPIIQDGKLVGAVTHVMINNPLRGYGLYAYWMYCNE